MSAKNKSLSKIYSGFQNLPQTDKSAYLDYLERVIRNEKNISEKNRLKRFKRKLQNEIRISKINAVRQTII